MREWIVIFQQIVGGNGRPIVTEYSSDKATFASLQAAKRHGFQTRGSDDFNIGVVENGRLVDFTWMDKSTEYDCDAIGAALYLPGHTRHD